MPALATFGPCLLMVPGWPLVLSLAPLIWLGVVFTLSKARLYLPARLLGSATPACAGSHFPCFAFAS